MAALGQPEAMALCRKAGYGKFGPKGAISVIGCIGKRGAVHGARKDPVEETTNDEKNLDDAVRDGCGDPAVGAG
jgi:hypothetical protein